MRPIRPAPITPLSTNTPSGRRSPWLHAALLGLLALSPTLPVQHVLAASTDISTVPLITSRTVAKPNILFILDDSGSMDSDYMPDDMNGTGKYGFYTSQCNGVAYNPTVTYDPPKTADNRSFPSMSLTAAWSDGFAPNLSSKVSSTTSLSLASSGSITVTVSSATNFSVGNAIALVNKSNTTQWMTGTVSAISGSTLTVALNFASASATSNSWDVGRTSTTSLSGETYYTYSGSETPLDWRYTTSGLNSTTTFATQCLSTIGNTPGSSVFAAVTLSTASAQATNYANWYSYYRKRILTMKTAVSRAFVALDNNKRVGFTTISDKTVTSSSFLNVADFDSAQKALFFGNLFDASPGSYTPLRGALSKAGRYFAKKGSSQTYDPMQYACQRNYAVLSTDGYWNTDTESSTYGPYKLDNSTEVGQQDGAEVRPMYDGAVAVVTTTTVTTKRSPQEQVISTYKTTTTSTRNAYTDRNGGNCSKSSQWKTTTQPQVSTRVVTSTDTAIRDTTRQSTRTVVVTNGVVTSDTTTPYVVTATSDISRSAMTVLSDVPGTWANFGNAVNDCTDEHYTNVVQYGTVTVGSPVGPTVDSATAVDQVTPIITVGTPTVVNSTTGGSTNSLADVAEYYYKTDLRTSALGNCTGSTGVDVCNNDVTVADRDDATWQHLTTFTIGLGVNGTLDYDPDYLTETSGAYVNLKNGPTTWPVPPTTGSAASVDDLWHAAINGRGRHFAASDPSALASALNGVFLDVSAADGAGTSAATSSLEPVAGADQIYLATYTTLNWTGEVEAYNFSLSNTGGVSTTHSWSAQAGLDLLTATTASSRSVYYMRGTTTGGATSYSLQNFTYTNLSADGYASWLDNLCNISPVATQCATLGTTTGTGRTTSQLSLANSGANLVAYLRGDPTYQQTTNATDPLYRYRKHRLGDIVGGSPVYVGTPVFNYGDNGYAAYKTSKVNRKPMLYVAANDGMLHAFSAQIGSDAGTELWAFVPSMVIPKMYRLANQDYTNNHQFYVDAPPVVADIQVGGTWKTILVGGLGAGGKGYYALDITNPTAPVALWEFTDTHLGLTYGAPIVTKRADGTWVVVFGSGINNNENGGDGNGRLYMLNAATGAKVLRNASDTLVNSIATFTSGTTAAGSTGTPSGLVKLNAWVPDSTNNTALRFYGADLQGNVWRFDTDNLVEPKGAALRLAQLKVATDTDGQPVTSRVELAEVSYGSSTYPVVLVGTGRYLGSSDLGNTTQQSLYAIKDPMTSTGWGSVRGSVDLVRQSLTVSGNSATVTSNAVDWSSKIGWYIDFANSGERVSVDMSVQYNTLAVVSSVPSTDTCAASGVSWLYYFNLNSGSTVAAAGSAAGEKLGNFLGMGLTWVQLSDGTSRLLIPASNATLQIAQPSISAASTTTTPRRTSWRELNN
jgi:type IV pilus assembly protein PilY1